MLCLTLLAAAGAQAAGPLECRDGGIIRGPADKKEIALEFTADEFVEGGPAILDQLARHRIKASFFLTGRCLRNAANDALVRRIISQGHYLGPHSDTHPLLCSWETPGKTLVTRDFFLNDMKRNLEAIESFGVPRASIRCFVPPYEWYNAEIVRWARELGLGLVDFTPGTRSTADYTETGAANYASSQAILESIEQREEKTGANGWLLLLHLGAGPRRADKMHDRLGELLDYLQRRGYQFVRVDHWAEQPPSLPDVKPSSP
jgi:peptidoglycan/xylan/chitin deacetylase (PgdA/CDA1 family)